MEQGPDELSERPDERGEDLDRLTDKPLEPAPLEDAGTPQPKDQTDGDAGGGVNDE